MVKRFEPKQVVFADPDNVGEWLVGISYKDEVICACCGKVFKLEEVVNAAKEAKVINPVYFYKTWVDITDDISGGELPEGLEATNDGIIEVVDETFEDEETAEFESYYYKDLE